MNVVELVRLEENWEYGTFGALKINKELFCTTLERNDEENATDISSIPAQQYICELLISPKFGLTYAVKNVPGRSNILFHWGNIKKNTKGCIMLGVFGLLNDVRAITNSKPTFTKFMNRMEGLPFHLTITENY